MDEQKREITLAAAGRIRYFRRLKNMSQEALALQSNLNPAYLGQVERGLKCPTLDTLYKISKALGVPLPELLRFDASDEYPMDDRLNAIMDRVPPARREEVYQIVENIVGLIGKKE